MQQLAIPGFEIIEPVCVTGSSQIFIGRCEDSLIRVWLKVIDLQNKGAKNSTTSAGQERLIAAANTATHLKHRNLAKVFRAGKHEKWLYQATEFIPGKDLAAETHNLCLLDKIYLIKQLASAIQYMSDKEFVHLNIKPSNIILRERDSRVFLTDPGMPFEKHKLVQWACYASPELLKGDNAGTRSDIYSLGAIFYYLLTGEAPADLDSVEQITRQHDEAAIPQLEGHLSLFQPLIDRTLAQDPLQRFSCGKAVIEALNELDDEAIVAADTQLVVPAYDGSPATPEQAGYEQARDNPAKDKQEIFDQRDCGLITTPDQALEENAEPSVNGGYQGYNEKIEPFWQDEALPRQSPIRDDLSAAEDRLAADNDEIYTSDEEPLSAGNKKNEAAPGARRQTSPKKVIEAVEKPRTGLGWKKVSMASAAALVLMIALASVAQTQKNGQAGWQGIAGKMAYLWQNGSSALVEGVYNTRVWLALVVAPSDIESRFLTRSEQETASGNKPETAALMAAEANSEASLDEQSSESSSVPVLLNYRHRPATSAEGNSQPKPGPRESDTGGILSRDDLVSKQSTPQDRKVEMAYASSLTDFSGEPIRNAGAGAGAGVDAVAESKVDRLSVEGQNIEGQILQRQVNQLLTRADVKRRAGDLLHPANDNAVVLYRQALELDQSNIHALQALTAIRSQVIESARAKLEHGELDAADALLLRISIFFGDDAEVLSLGARLEKARKAAQKDTGTSERPVVSSLGLPASH